MKKTKYILSGGIAFTEQEDLQKLSDYAKKGWLLDRWALFGYTLKKGKAQELQYSLDFQEHADDEYFLLFKEAGWQHVCSTGHAMHIFSASPGTKPIYSDVETIIDRYEREKRSVGKAALSILVAMVFLLLFDVMSLYGWLPEAVGTISEILLAISTVILVFPGLPYLAYQRKLKKLSNT
ncbi:DUF2812 domain-containing protein [Priestia aryabhattai]|uniref:DUF2812 domain-containing protein n=1 Tax=Priestia TaxID=2800373 RepID=UPI000532CE46|nr:DUF2812 domain-containing protein [Priestia aryabhattai]MBY0074484.1 DUF2812 domain-containing protein [Priestia aryabhattai]MED4012154.1 DUF2812 domain-containing protein [Priestia aryabhattai]